MGKWDRIFTIIVTATLTSAAWIVAGATVFRPPADPVALSPGSPVSDAQAPAQLFAPRPAATREEGERSAAGGGAWTIPVANIRPEQLSDTFTQSRAGGARVHNAIDIAAPVGTPVVAAKAGIVEKLFLSDDGGMTIYIRVPEANLVTYYAHLNSYAPSLREGARVRRGQVLGTVGYSGNASPDSPHLHFAIWRSSPGRSVHDSGEVLNPYPLLRGR